MNYRENVANQEIEGISFCPVCPGDEGILKEFNYLAAYAFFENVGWAMPDISAVEQDAYFRLFYENWGRANDIGFFAVEAETETEVGAAWFRQFSDPYQDDMFLNGIKVPPHELAIAVLPNFQRRGIGTALLRTLVKAATEREDIFDLGLCVAIQNVDAQRLYESVGFQAIGVLEGHHVMSITTA